MDSSGILGLAFVLLFIGLILLFGVLARRRERANLRRIPAFSRLSQQIRLAVEDGTRVHLSLGRGSPLGPQSAAAFVGLSMLRRIARITSASDRPPIASSGEGTLAILAQDTLQSAYRTMGAEEQYDPLSSWLTGLTPFSYAAGTIPLIAEEMVSSNVLAGSFGNEVALVTDAGERNASFTLAGTDNVSAQAILFATAQEPLIGEELYAGGAYLEAGPLHVASLHAQDSLRVLLVIAILAGVILKLLGFF